MKRTCFFLFLMILLISLSNCTFTSDVCTMFGHYYEEIVTGATCNEEGYTTYTCVECKYTYTSKKVKALGHDLTIYAAIEATCEKEGLTEGSKCSRCDYKVDQIVVPALGHDIIDVEEVTPTCTTVGNTKGQKCTRCEGKNTFSIIPTLEHNIVPSNKVEPTCEKEGYTEFTCTSCNYNYIDNYIERIDHDYDENKCINCGIERYQLSYSDLVKYQGGINSENGSIINSFTNNWYSIVQIPEGAEQVNFQEFKTLGSFGIAFFENENYIDGSCNKNAGGKWNCLDIPEKANYLYYGYLYDEIAEENGYGKFEYIEFLGHNLLISDDNQIMDLPDTQVHSFSVSVDLSTIESSKYSFGTDYGYIMLPTNYTKDGEPTRLIIMCHGAGASIDTYKSNDKKTNNYTYLTKLGYAIMDMYACPNAISQDNSALHYGNPVVLECYKAGYEYVMKHFNLAKDGIFVIGSSMGGLSSFQIVQSGYFPVIAQVGYCPVVDLFKQAYCNPWTTATYQRQRISNYFNFEGTVAFSSNKFPSNAEIEYYKNNFEKTIEYSPILKNVISGNINDIFDYIPNKSVGLFEEEEKIYNNFISEHPVPLLVFHNLDDSTVSYRYSKYIIDMINRGNGNAKLYTFSTGGHNAWANGTDFNVTDIDGNAFTIKESQYKTYLYLNHILYDENHEYEKGYCAICNKEEPYEVMNLQFDDYIDISNRMVELIDEENDVLSVSNNYLIASNIGQTKIYMDDQLFLINVDKAKINIVTIMGQSNAGNHFANSTSDITCPIGTAYWWGNGLGVNANEPISYTEPSMGFHTPLLAELYAQSAADGNPIKNVMIWQEGITSKNGKSITSWAASETNTSGTTATATMIKKCVDYYLSNNDKYEIVGNGVYWIQGESDVKMDPKLYTKLFMAMWSDLKEAGAEYVAFFRVRKGVSYNEIGSEHKDLDYHGSLTAQLKMINDNSDMFLVTSITENWIGEATEVHSTNINEYISMMKTYGNIENFSDSYGNTATIENGILTTSMKTLYGSNNRCHYGKFGAAIIGCDAAKNIYEALYSDGFAFVMADASGYVDNQRIFNPGEKIQINYEDLVNNISFRTTCDSVGGILSIKVYSGEEDITVDVISEELNYFGTIDIGLLKNYNDIKIIVSFNPLNGNTDNIEINVTKKS